MSDGEGEGKGKEEVEGKGKEEVEGEGKGEGSCCRCFQLIVFFAPAISINGQVYYIMLFMNLIDLKSVVLGIQFICFSCCSEIYLVGEEPCKLVIMLVFRSVEEW